MRRILFALALATSLASGALGAQTPAVQRSARTTLYVGIIPAELAQAAVAAHARPTPHINTVPKFATGTTSSLRCSILAAAAVSPMPRSLPDCAARSDLPSSRHSNPCG